MGIYSYYACDKSNPFNIFAKPETVKLVALDLATNTTFSRYSLTHSTIGNENCSLLALAIRTNSTLTALSFQHSTFSDEGFRCITESLIVNQTIKSIDLSAAGILQTAGKIECVSQLLKANSLISLNLKFNGVDKGDLTPFVEAIKHNSSLTSLDLSYTHMTPEVKEKVVEAAWMHPNLIKFDLKDPLEAFHSQEVIDLTERNKHNSRIRQLTLYELLFPNSNG